MRIVSLCPSITETLVVFGLESQLVGVTRFCIHPTEVTAKVRKVGGTKDPNVECIEALQPDLIFMNAEENTKAAYDRLRRDFEVDLSEPKRVREVPALLRHFGERTATRDIAERHAVELERAMELLERRHKRSFSFAYLIWRKPWMAAATGTYIDDLFQLAGGRNVFGGAERYPTIELAELGSAERVFLPDEPYPFTDKHVGQLKPQLPNAELLRLSGDDCCWHGVRSLRGVQTMARLMEAEAGSPFE